MQRVGGYASYRALCDDVADYNDVLIAVRGEGQAARITALKAKK